MYVAPPVGIFGKCQRAVHNAQTMAIQRTWKDLLNVLLQKIPALRLASQLLPFIVLSHKLHVYLEQVVFLFRFQNEIITPCNFLSESKSEK